jgi:hypothetical protein
MTWQDDIDNWIDNIHDTAFTYGRAGLSGKSNLYYDCLEYWIDWTP